ncbi:MAG: lipid kinase [Hormoscilla sp. SP5CHS1]|nr:lipid kinase [Hormoscilla sp. SP12CHS1]MBC6452905.1 lipid kinase [Hormoscilla sp. SP5CHS1]
MNQRALFFVNRLSRQGRKNRIEAIVHLRRYGFELVEEPVSNPGEIPELIRQHQNKVDLVIIGGGDGTMNTAVDALVDTQLPLGILPMGTANDLARTLKIPLSIPAACQTIATGQTHYIDLGWVNGKHYFNVASMGLSVNITRSLNKRVKRRWGILAYAIAAIRVLARSRPFRAEIRCNGQSIQVKTVQIAVGNGLYYGGGMAIASDAAIDDQRLDLYSLGINHWWEMFPLLPALRQGRLGNIDNVFTLEGTEMEVLTKKPISINTDGEITTKTPAHFRVIPRILPVLVPSSRS